MPATTHSLLRRLYAVWRYILSCRPLRHLARPLAFLRFIWRSYARDNAEVLQSRRKRGDGSSEQGALASDGGCMSTNSPSMVVHASSEPATYPSLRNEHALSSSHPPSHNAISRLPRTPHWDPDAESLGSDRGSGPYSFTVETASQESVVSCQRTSADGDHLSITMSRPSSRVSMRTRHDRLSRHITPSDSRRQPSRAREKSRSPRQTPAASPSHSTASLTLQSNASSVDQHNVALPAGESMRPRRCQKMYPVVQTARYDRPKYSKEMEHAFEVKPMKMSYEMYVNVSRKMQCNPYRMYGVYRPGLPVGWEVHTHPEGTRYFFSRARVRFFLAKACP
ncbi:uncharacterized protein C8Q71DRAFT_79605 [Rhodofomes roseus]|uniref:WW domain-containing protein n=1 Tax=Rhodofomes roseus TaxID=34475 RepID=A0ABQ8KGI8_9APHY|nr:uncharacterized protein C8Q71DRAFT_79605 [Rhodofomes roseus]KAH9836357.1 hypothetical protein C8Q71DRAFT_79605 [Rhodofomes roseus]